MNVLKWLGYAVLAVLLLGVMVGFYYLIVVSIAVIASAALITGAIFLVALAIRESHRAWRRRKA